METRQMTAFFSSAFSALFVTLIFLFENIQKFILMWVPAFGPFWSVKYLNLRQKLSIRTTHHTFLEKRHPEDTKSPYKVLSPKWSQKRLSSKWSQKIHQLMHYFWWRVVNLLLKQIFVSASCFKPSFGFHVF